MFEKVQFHRDDNLPDNHDWLKGGAITPGGPTEALLGVFPCVSIKVVSSFCCDYYMLGWENI